MSDWEKLLQLALRILGSAAPAGSLARQWSLGGGTALMIRMRHRASRDIDIFVPDPQVLGLLSPRLNPLAESLTPDYLEQANFLKLFFAEGQIDFLVSPALTAEPVTHEHLLGQSIRSRHRRRSSPRRSGIAHGPLPRATFSMSPRF